MNFISKYNISKDEVLNSFNFLKKSDVIYAASVPTDEFYSNFNIPSNEIVYQQNDHTLFKSTKFKIKNNDIVFCNTFFTKQLFNHLNSDKKLKNITLITHQADLSITKSLYRLKPKCISKWYGINIEHKDKNLIPIPLGIANTKNEKNLVYEDFYNFNNVNALKKEKIYCSFNINTNYFHRVKILKIINNNDFVKGFDLDLEDYIKNLHTYKFTLCPWGNGLDSHRFWESLYSNSIPITKNHAYYQSFKEINKLLIDDYSSINLLNRDRLNLDMNYEVLTISWWIKLMKKNEIQQDNEYVYFHENELINTKNKKKYYAQIKLINRKKILSTLIRKIHKKIFNINF